MSRWKAAGIHLSISVAIGLIVGALLLGVWYPPPLFHAAGADTLVLLLVSVDIVLGPLLTCVVFKQGKKGLKFDLALIAIVQTAALVYGMSVVLRSRPVFLVAAVDRFSLVSASDLAPQDIAAGQKPEFRSLSWFGPRTVGALLPPEGRERTKIMLSGIGGKDIDKMPKYYVDYSQVAQGLLQDAKPLDDLSINTPGQREELDRALTKIGRAADQVVWVPLTARKANLVMLLDHDSGDPLGAVAINPWKK